MNSKIPSFSPGRILLGSFLFAMGIGTFLLSLPEARTVDMSFIDILFTTTSSLCVTGLKVVPIDNFTMFGKYVILALIQIGGLGLMTLSFFLASLFLNLGMTTQLLAGQILEFEVWSRIRTFLILIIGITFSCEFIGTIILYTQFKHIPTIDSPWFYAFFHSISAFCNAGISLFENSFINFQHNPIVLISIICLMTAGSIGFIVWYDFIRIIKGHFKQDKNVIKFSLHTKLVIWASVILIVNGTIAIWFLEKGNLLLGLSLKQQVLNSLFTSISARGVGYLTVDINHALLPTLFLFLPLMFIGASPGSTGSGIKTTTFVIFIATVSAILRNRESVEIRGREIPNDQVYKVMAIVAIAIFWIFIITFLLLLSEPTLEFIQVFFETVSAFGCTGLSTGITSILSSIGKIILIITMLIGRIGSLTLVLALRKNTQKHLYQYPKERVMIG